MATEWKNFEKRKPIPKKCPFLKEYYSWSGDLNNPYIVPLQEANWIEENFKDCIQNQCAAYDTKDIGIYHSNTTGYCRLIK